MMKPRAALALISAMVVSILGTPGIGETQGPLLSLLFGDVIFVRLDGYEEVPALSTTGKGFFQASIVGQTITFTLHYEDLEGDVTAAHIHFGQFSVNGGIAAFLCGGGGKPACPPAPATISDTIVPADIIGPAAQGIEPGAPGGAPGAFAELVAAIRSGIAYANVHSTKWPAGEIRAQLPGSLHDLFGKHD
jgi:CHRD domain